MENRYKLWYYNDNFIKLLNIGSYVMVGIMFGCAIIALIALIIGATKTLVISVFAILFSAVINQGCKMYLSAGEYFRINREFIDELYEIVEEKSDNEQRE